MNRPGRLLAALRIGVVCLGASVVFGPTPWALGAAGTADLVLIVGGKPVCAAGDDQSLVAR